MMNENSFLRKLDSLNDDPLLKFDDKSNENDIKSQTKKPFEVNLLKITAKKPSILEKKSSKIIENKQANIIYEEPDEITLKDKGKDTSRKPSRKPSGYQISSKEDILSPNKRGSENMNLLEEIRKIVKDSSVVSDSNSDMSEEDEKLPVSASNLMPLKKEKDFPSAKKTLKEPKELTSPVPPAFTVLKKIERNFSVNAEAANCLLAKIIEGDRNKRNKNYMTKNNILKMIGNIYAEKLMNAQNNLNNPLHVLIYDLFLNKYGLKKIAENKFKQVKIKDFILFYIKSLISLIFI